MATYSDKSGTNSVESRERQPTTLTYSDNEVASYGYDATSGWLSSLSTTPAGGSATTLLGSIGYSGAGGAAGHATSASVGGGTYTFGASYDADTRLSSLSVSNTSTSALLFQSQRGYDATSNVTAVATTLSAGTDNQVFCYDDENQLVWAGSTGTPSCGSSLTPGSLSSASYTQAFGYDTLDWLTSGPLGSYAYGDSAHLHAVTSIGSGKTGDSGLQNGCTGARTFVGGFDSHTPLPRLSKVAHRSLARCRKVSQGVARCRKATTGRAGFAGRSAAPASHSASTTG